MASSDDFVFGVRNRIGRNLIDLDCTTRVRIPRAARRSRSPIRSDLCLRVQYRDQRAGLRRRARATGSRWLDSARPHKRCMPAKQQSDTRILFQNGPTGTLRTRVSPTGTTLHVRSDIGSAHQGLAFGVNHKVQGISGTIRDPSGFACLGAR